MHLPPELAVEAPQVVPHQHGKVVAPLPQGWQVDGEHAQAIVQVGPEPALVRPRLQVAVRGRDHPHVGPDRLVTTDPLERLLLEDA